MPDLVNQFGKATLEPVLLREHVAYHDDHLIDGQCDHLFCQQSILSVFVLL
jgi:hypothetical protein